MTRSVIDLVTACGAAKDQFSQQHPLRFFTRCAIGGSFVAVASLLSLLCCAWFYTDAPAVAKLLGGITFATALILIVLFSAELFTGTNMVMAITLYDGKTTIRQVLRVWLMCYVGNLVGIFIFCLLVSASGASRDLLAAYLTVIMPGKLSNNWYELIFKGILCNFLVCLGAYAGFRLQSETAKIIVIMLAVTAFVMAGMEHCVANMAYFLLYIFLTGDFPALAMGHSMLFATLGNIIGGAVVLGLPLWLAAEPKKA